MALKSVMPTGSRSLSLFISSFSFLFNPLETSLAGTSLEDDASFVTLTADRGGVRSTTAEVQEDSRAQSGVMLSLRATRDFR